MCFSVWCMPFLVMTCTLPQWKSQQNRWSSTNHSHILHYIVICFFFHIASTLLQMPPPGREATYLAVLGGSFAKLGQTSKEGKSWKIQICYQSHFLLQILASYTTYIYTYEPVWMVLMTFGAKKWSFKCPRNFRLPLCTEIIQGKINPFTAPACKISGLKSARIHACKQCIWWSCYKSTFSTVHFDRSPVRCSCEGGKKALIKLMISSLAFLSVAFWVTVRQAWQWRGQDWEWR